MILTSKIIGASIRHGISLLLIICVASCSGPRRPAPVRNLSTEPGYRNPIKRVGAVRYTVRKSDTLYSIAFRFGLDFQQLAKINAIKIPYTIYPGQVLELRSTRKQMNKKPKSKVVAKGGNNKNVAKQHKNLTIKSRSDSKNKGVQGNSAFDNKKKVTAWHWPVSNNSQRKFSSGKDGQQGINIEGSLGDPISAAAAGRVVYSGNGLVGYGNLIIIKHNQSYLSAYAHTDRLLVKEKDTVKAGQKIATMGKNGTGQIQLHFEIRYQGRHVDPLKYLQSTD